MALTITERQVGGVTLLDLSGRITLGEGSQVLRKTIARLVGAGHKKLVLNMEDVGYIDSSGFGELVSAYTTTRNCGGTLAMMSLREKTRDQLQITKLFTVFDIYENEAKALTAFDVAIFARCPMCGHSSNPPFKSGDTGSKTLKCRKPGCEATFDVAFLGGMDSEFAVKSVRVSTYVGEYFEILSGHPISIRIVGRLDMFSSSAFKRVERILSGHKSVYVDLSRTVEVDADGRNALLSFIRDSKHNFRAVVSLEGLNESDSVSFEREPGCFPKTRNAVEALGPLAEDEWITKVAWEPR
jgi:anti-sigma B factor antagonist